MAAVRRELARGGSSEQRIVTAYLVVQVVLLLLIKVGEAFSLGRFTNVSMYVSVVTGTAVALYFFSRYGSRPGNAHANIIVAGLVATALADLLLTFIDTEWARLPGFALFCVTQAIYGVYLGLSPRALIARACTAVVLIVLMGIAGNLTFANAIGLINISLVLCNAVQAWIGRNADVSLLFKIGITLFFLCDASIAVRTLTSGTVHVVVAFLVWAFYVPAQTLITMSYVRSVRPD